MNWRDVDLMALLEASVVTFEGQPIGTVAAMDDATAALNYDQIFTRDFAVSAFAYMLAERADMVRNFLLASVRLQRTERHFDCFKAGEGLMPASFKVEQDSGSERLVADFGEHAIARVPPVDSGFWWLLMLRTYERCTGDAELVGTAEVQGAIRMVLDLSLTPRFDMFPTMLVSDGSFMIDRRMGVYGYPIDIQALFFAALQAAEALLADSPENQTYRQAVRTRIAHLAYHIRTYYWLDLDQLTRIYRYGVEEYGDAAVNKFNIYPETIPTWLMDWLPESGGYFCGNLGPGRMDYRYFAQGNLLAVVSGLATPEQGKALMCLLQERYDDLIGEVPLKLCFPALEDHDWRILTGMDPKNRAWSYHNGGNWPFLLWLLAAACTRSAETELLERAVGSAGRRLAKDDWPEYYDGPRGRLVGKEARRRQTWTIAGHQIASQVLANRAAVDRLGFGQETIAAACGLEASPA
jgi:glycogen debranching enzyme